MGLDIDVLKHATDAALKVLKAVKELGHLFGSAARSGVAAFDFASARLLLKRLRKLNVDAIKLYKMQGYIFSPVLAKFAHDPTDENWNAVLGHVQLAIGISATMSPRRNARKKP